MPSALKFATVLPFKDTVHNTILYNFFANFFRQTPNFLSRPTKQQPTRQQQNNAGLNEVVRLFGDQSVSEGSTAFLRRIGAL